MRLPLKTISPDAIPKALEKAQRYRLLNEPMQAESICLDVLRTDPENQSALVTLLLALTDQFAGGHTINEIQPDEVIAKLRGDYERAYYSGIVAERRATALLGQNAAHSSFRAYDFLTLAMRHYERAAELRPAGNDDAILRWNTCARLINNRSVRPRAEESAEHFLE